MYKNVIVIIREDTAELANQLNELLTAGGFELRKWATNDKRVLQSIPDSCKIESIIKIPTDITVCLLGIIWNPVTESCFDTKRKLLSEIFKIFDPLGWISPVIIAVKILIQKLWLLNLDWDEELPNDIKSLAEI